MLRFLKKLQSFNITLMALNTVVFAMSKGEVLKGNKSSLFGEKF